ncbi:hypothetical protein CDAR_458211 [Caerostris darwini]|uniref:Uncharacterized protein n=1 Tax=Caerostris darwini TaxID=1538125 RepID=A0AAV4WW33_9ARAC|nr:hypothetical protein CDAR_458211 [Caerostris darwini]
MNPSTYQTLQGNNGSKKNMIQLHLTLYRSSLLPESGQVFAWLNLQQVWRDLVSEGKKAVAVKYEECATDLNDKKNVACRPLKKDTEKKIAVQTKYVHKAFLDIAVSSL